MKTKGDFLGEFEELILIAVASLEEAYGVSVMKYIQKEADRSCNISAVHEGLKRLAKKGLVDSKMGDATNVRGGRRKRQFQLTASGSQKLEDLIQMKLNLYRKVPNFNLKISP